MNNTADCKTTKNLGIGDVIISEKKEEIIWTVLGSCISVIFHVDNIVSMICHAQLPYNSTTLKCRDECPHPCNRNFDQTLDNRYVKCVLEFMIKKLKTYKFNMRDLKTTLFGGASIIKKDNDKLTIGEQNVRTAKKILESYNIKLTRVSVGGLKGCNLWYYTDTNKLFLRVISNNSEKFELLDNM
jgi:chemotaxis receptor (MCP) glutamine deamidase CheD